MSPTLLVGGTLHELIRGWATFHIANWFYSGTSIFFIALEQVVPHVKCNSHTCSTSPKLCCSLGRLENSAHVMGRVRNESHIDRRSDLTRAYKRLDYSPYYQLVL